MNLRVKEVIVRGKGKHLKDKNDQLRYDDDKNPIIKYTILGYTIEDTEGGVEEKVVSKENAGDYVFNLLNADLIKEIKAKKEAGNYNPEELSGEFIVDIENATVNTRTNTGKDGSQESTFYLKARTGVIRSLEIPELVVQALDENGVVKPKYASLVSSKPKSNSGKPEKASTSVKSKKVAGISEELANKHMIKFQAAIENTDITGDK